MIGGAGRAPALSRPCAGARPLRAGPAHLAPCRAPLARAVPARAAAPPRPHLVPFLLPPRERRRSGGSSSPPSSSSPRPVIANAAASGGTGEGATTATATAPSSDDLEEVINADAVPPTNALRVRGPLSVIHPHPGPWAPPLIAEDDRAPEAFMTVTSLRPGPLWYPAWMRYRRADANDIFWTDKLFRNSMMVPMFEKRWTVWSTVLYLCQHWRFRGFPPQFRYLIASAYRSLRHRLYEGHKRLVLWQCKLEAALAKRAVERREQRAAAEAAGGGGDPSSSGSSSSSSSASSYPHGPRPGASFSRLMAMRRLHWVNSPVAELLYLQNVAITGRVHMLPPRMLRGSPPTLFWLF